jgi:hypothetical protein
MNKTDELLAEQLELNNKELKTRIIFDEKMMEVTLHGDKMEQIRRGIEACMQILRIENISIRALACKKLTEFLDELKPFKDLTE